MPSIMHNACAVVPYSPVNVGAGKTYVAYLSCHVMAPRIFGGRIFVSRRKLDDECCQLCTVIYLKPT